MYAARLARQCSQEEVARAVGISQRHYSRIETGQGDPSWRVAVALADFFGVPVHVLLAQGAGDTNVPAPESGG